MNANRPQPSSAIDRRLAALRTGLARAETTQEHLEALLAAERFSPAEFLLQFARNSSDLDSLRSRFNALLSELQHQQR